MFMIVLIQGVGYDVKRKIINFEMMYQIIKIAKEIKKSKIPFVRLDKSLNKYDDKIMFP